LGDSEYSSHWKKADVVKAGFDQLVEDSVKEALALPDDSDVWKVRALQAEAVIEKFMAQPEQTPYITMPPSTPMWSIPLQRTWVGLTDDEIRKWWASENGLEDCDMCKIDDFVMVAQAIEAKLKEKNS
jgi:uncharacterized UPF0160 family protein